TMLNSGPSRDISRRRPERSSMISWTASRSKLRQTLARNSQVSGLRLRDDPSLRMLNGSV
ncbi:MAG: hypothetical protein OXC95_00530, partial [Dehalococcoidia bacterium]|nr:hypothetical protein [Dehalococcoidia bacterium]